MNALNENSTATVEVAPTTTPASWKTLRLAKLSIGFIGRSSDAVLIAWVGRILTGLAGNTHFASPRPALAEIEVARDAFAATVASNDRGTAAIARRNAARDPLEQGLRDLALYVQQASQGDRVILVSSGYPLHKTRKPAGLPGDPMNLRLKQGKSGCLIARCNAVPYAVSYQWRYATTATPLAYTLVDPTGKASCTITGLTPGTQYSVQGRSVGRKGTSDWSEVATLFVN